MTHRRPTALRRTLALGLLASAALGVSATQAFADGETITLAQNDPTAVVGRATNFTASGTLNPDDTMFGFDIFIFLKDPTADPTCAATFDEESATAMHSGGKETWISPATGFQVGAGPTFDQPFKITFTGSGDYLLCGYVQGDFSTLASGQLRGVVAPGRGAGKPSVVRAPWITRGRHVLTCHAGRWANAPTSLGYRWYVKGHGKRIGSRRRLAVRRSLMGRKVVCRVTARNAAGRTTASSRPVRAR